MKKLLLFSVTIMLPLVVSADVVEIGGVWYDLVSKVKQAEVISNPNSQIKYSGSVEIPSSVTYEGIEYSVTSIRYQTFYLCNYLTSVTIPNSVTSIGNAAFYFCSKLTSITIPDGVTSIEEYTFKGCSSLTSITIPYGVTSIGNNALADCYGLTSITIPNSVTNIGNNAFSNCHGLTSIIIPNSVINIGSQAFEGCSGLTTVSLPSSLMSIFGGVFLGCSSLPTITIPSSVKSIGGDAFLGCSSLTSITIPNSVSTLGNNAFYGCSGLKEVSIGSGIDFIYNNVFANCPALADLYCYAENVPSTSSNVFDGSYIESATLHVPAASINAYKTTSPWSGFGTFKTLEGGEVVIHKCATPTINYSNGELIFNSETEEVGYVSEITDTDIKKYYDATISLTAIYTISVYATKNGYENSDVAMAALCWIDKEPTTEGITDGVAQMPSKAVLIQSEGGILKVEGVDEGTQVFVYTPDGKQAGSAVCSNGAALVGTSIRPGNTAIVKIGEKSVKVIMR